MESCLLRGWGWDHGRRRHPACWATLILKSWRRLRELQITGGGPAPPAVRGVARPPPVGPRAFPGQPGRAAPGPVPGQHAARGARKGLETCRLLPATEAPRSLPPLEGSHPEKEQRTEAKEAWREGPVAWSPLPERGSMGGRGSSGLWPVWGSPADPESAPGPPATLPRQPAGRGHVLAPASLRRGQEHLLVELM